MASICSDCFFSHGNNKASPGVIILMCMYGVAKCSGCFFEAYSAIQCQECFEYQCPRCRSFFDADDYEAVFPEVLSDDFDDVELIDEPVASVVPLVS
ncbi:MAG: hypothetical protein Harvfovirus9_21 [Harvfovirus sp.]|uniref:Uncharacterized protein n=1 Tax=Harvfovirus sp. TaxID=2487768 RepID=A0A3G5A3V8_9VIRU|nr:MAG: hypothetical protein Harvfovirus9_21 [Harvfovirus sp.]